MRTGAARLRFVAIVIAVIAGWAATVLAGGRKVIVLPIEGTADPGLRTKLGAVVLRVARAGGGSVTTGDTTFTETAAAVGCDPSAQACADTVLSTLGVDELVYGTATTSSGQTTLVVTRVTKGKAQTQSTALEANDPPEKAESGLRPLYPSAAASTGSGSTGSGSTTAGSGAGSSQLATSDGSGSAATAAVGSSRESFFDTRERKLGFGFIAGGSLAVVIGLALWSSESSIQDQIDGAPTSSANDIIALRALEDRASNYAWEGNILVVLGLAAGGVGAYYLWTDHQARVSATVAPIDKGTGAMAVVGGHW